MIMYRKIVIVWLINILICSPYNWENIELPHRNGFITYLLCKNKKQQDRKEFFKKQDCWLYFVP